MVVSLSEGKKRAHERNFALFFVLCWGSVGFVPSVIMLKSFFFLCKHLVYSKENYYLCTAQ